MVIYKVTNLLNKKFYIGKDINNSPEYFGSGTLIKKAIKKYGKENFSKEILEFCDNESKLNEREKFWIKELNAIKEGYNLTEGGTGGDTYSNNPRKLEISEKLKKRIVSEEIKKIRLETLKPYEFKAGEDHPYYGKKQSEDTKKKRNETFLKNGFPMKNKNHTKESNEKNRKSHLGKKHNEETKLKMKLKKIGIPKEIVECPFCGKKGGKPQMCQWHFENCKSKK